MKIFEGLEEEELKGLVFDIVSIDQYKPKIGTDAETVVIAFTVKYEEPATDLANFIQTSYIELLDVEASTVPNEEGYYKVFVEIDRTPNLYKKIYQLLCDINNITGTKGGKWKYVAYKMSSPRVFTKENLEKDVIFTSQEYDAHYKKKTAEDSVRERIEFLLKY